jgi:hypothetical protein
MAAILAALFASVSTRMWEAPRNWHRMHGSVCRKREVGG